MIRKMKGAESMKKALILGMLVILPLCCKSKKEILFCEGVSPEGKGMQCGMTFSTGEVTALVSLKENFDVESLQVKIFEHKKHKDELLESHTITVKPDGRSANTNLSFYNEGTFRVTIIGKEEKEIARGEIKIIDTY